MPNPEAVALQPDWLRTVQRVAVGLGSVGMFLAGAETPAAAYSGQHMGISDERSVDPATTLRHESTIRPQIVLDHIHHIAIPGDLWKPNQKGYIRPTSGFLRASAIGFKTDCGDSSNPASWGNTWSYRSFSLTPAGFLYKECPEFAGGSGSFKYGKDDQYLKKMRTLGNMIEASVGIKTMENATSIRGNRKEITAEYHVSKPASQVYPHASEPTTVEKIIIYAHKKASIVGD